MDVILLAIIDIMAAIIIIISTVQMSKRGLLKPNKSMAEMVLNAVLSDTICLRDSTLRCSVLFHHNGPYRHHLSVYYHTLEVGTVPWKLSRKPLLVPEGGTTLDHYFFNAFHVP